MGDGRWVARCPAHEDRSPSLSVRDTGERVLVHCFAGCDAEDILAAVGLHWRDLYGDTWTGRAPIPAAQKALARLEARRDPLDFERRLLQIAADDVRAGKVHSPEDRARIELAMERVAAAKARAA